MNILTNSFKALTGNFLVKCEYCKKQVKRKEAHTEKIKRLEFVHPKLTFFCDELCCENYMAYEKSVPKKASLCPSCPVPPAAQKIN